MTTPKRPKQHWIPAVLLAGFSRDLERDWTRDKRLYVLQRGLKKARITAARSLAYERGLYD
jgi:hypothetical protein